MPAVSKKQREAMAIAEHHPEKLNKENKGLADMSKGQLHDFASTKEKGLPEHAGRGYAKDYKHGGHGRMKHPRGG